MLLLLVVAGGVAVARPQMRETDLFVERTGGYHTYRIPAIVPVGGKTLLAFCEGRKNSASDTGEIHLLLKRSLDGGETWGDVQLVASDGADTCGNPCPIVDRSTGIVWLLFCKNPGHHEEGTITDGHSFRSVWVTKSADLGVTWSKPVDITKQVKEPTWTWYATGPGHGIQLKNGRLLAACDHVSKITGKPSGHHSHVIYSDDHGRTWKIGGVVDAGTNESTAVELSDGRVYINCRNSRSGIAPPVGRVCAWSTDGGVTFGKPFVDEKLIEPICEGSVVGVPSGGNCVLFSNPGSGERKNMTVRLSSDGCVTWPVSRALWTSHSGYSDLCVARDGDVCCLYERGDRNSYQKISFVKFNLEWLAEGKDTQ